MTILEAKVLPQNNAVLTASYQEAVQSQDEGLVSTVLVQARDDPTLWRIMTTWESWEALQKMRESGGTPRGVLIFQSAGAQPKLSIFEIVAQSDFER